MTSVVHPISARFAHLRKADTSALADMTATSATASRQATAQNTARAIVEAAAKARGGKPPVFATRGGVGGQDADMVDCDELTDADATKIADAITKAARKAAGV